MKKYLALILATLMLVAAFAGCGKKEDAKAGPVDGGTYYNYFTTAATTVNPLTTQATNPWTLIDLISSSLYTTCLKDDKSGWEYRPTLAAELPKKVDADGYVWEYRSEEHTSELQSR